MGAISGKLKQIEALQNGNGTQYLLNRGHEILGNPIYIHDVDYKLIAHTENIVEDDPLWNELIATGVHGEASIELFKNEGFIDNVASAKTIAYLTSPKIKYDRMLGKIRNNENIVVACLDVVACNKPFQNGDAQAFEALCGVVSKEIGRQAFYQAYGEQYQEKIIRDLLDGNIRDKRLYTRRVESIYEGLHNTIRIAAVEIPKSDFEKAGPRRFQNVLKEADCSFKYAVYDKYLTFFFSSDDPAIDIDRCLENLMQVFEKNNMRIGVSSGFENLFIARKYFTEAVSALCSGLRRNDKQRIYLYSGCR